MFSGTTMGINVGSRSETAVTTAILGATLVFVGYFVKKALVGKKTKQAPYPPGPKGYPIVGNLLAFPDESKGETFDTLNLDAAKEFGLIFSINVPLILGRMIIIADPELARHVLVKKNYPKSKLYEGLSPILGSKSMVSMSNGKEWAGMRKAFHRGFQPDFLKKVIGVMTEKLTRFTEAIDDDINRNQATNVLERSQAFTADVIVSAAFGEDWGDDKHPARTLEDEICRLYSILALNPLRHLFDFKTHRKMNQTGVMLEREMRKILDRRLANSTDNEESSKDICSLAIAHMKKVSGGSLTKEDKECIVDQLKTFYFAGHDTTATTIAWVMWELSQHSDSLVRVRDELQEKSIWNDPKVLPSYEDLQTCEYLDAVIKEVLRLYPPASSLTRQNPDPNETYNGYLIGGGATLKVSTYIMGRHPDLWKEPDKFRPERMIDGSEGDVSAKLLPFSKGPRDCIGKYFALLEAKLAISVLVTRYDLQCVDPDDHLQYHLTNVPRGGAKVRFTSRT